MSIARTNTGSSGIRNRALIAILYCSGLRIAEALALYPKLEAAPTQLKTTPLLKAA